MNEIVINSQKIKVEFSKFHNAYIIKIKKWYGWRTLTELVVDVLGFAGDEDLTFNTSQEAIKYVNKWIR